MVDYARRVSILKMTESQAASTVGKLGEVISNTTTRRLHSMDGATPGGHPHALLSDLEGLSGGGGGAHAYALCSLTLPATITGAPGQIQLDGTAPAAGEGAFVVSSTFRSTVANGRVAVRAVLPYVSTSADTVAVATAFWSAGGGAATLCGLSARRLHAGATQGDSILLEGVFEHDLDADALDTDITVTVRLGARDAGATLTLGGMLGAASRPWLLVQDLGAVDDAAPLATLTIDDVTVEAELGAALATLAIADVTVEAELGGPAVASVGDVTVAAGATTATVTVTLSRALTDASTIAWATADGTAEAGTHYTAASGVLELDAGATSGTITITVAPVAEGDPARTFTVALSDPTGDVVLGDASATITIHAGVSAMQWLVTSGQNIMLEDGSPFRLKSVNWYGTEGILMPLPLWDRAYRTITVDGVEHLGVLDQIASLGFNSIRLPICEDITWPGRKLLDGNSVSLVKNPDFMIDPGADPEEFPQQPNVKPTIEILDLIVAHARTLGLRIILDMHALAPNTDNTVATGGRWYTTATPGTAGSTAGATGEPRNEAQWIAAWTFLAERYADEPAVAGFDLVNEPHNSTWDDNASTGWPAAAERCAAAIQAVNPNALIIVEGIFGQVTVEGTTYWTVWGGDLSGVASRPVELTVPNKLVYSPHEYATVGAGSGPAWLSDPSFPDNLPAVWDAAWGYIAKSGTAPVWIGEFGGIFGAGEDVNNAWIAKLHEYTDANNIGWCYWAFNEGSTGFPGILAGDRISTTAETLDALAPMLTATPVNIEPPAATPASVLDIGAGSTQNHFAVQIGRTGDVAVTTKTLAEIAAGFDEDPYFTVVGDAVQFWTRMDAPTTSGSSYPRSELRETLADGSNAAWDALTGTHVLHGRSRITHLPAVQPEVVVAQVHNGSTDRIAIRTQVISGQIKLLCRINGSAVTPRLAEPYTLGTEFEWKIELIEGVANIYYNDMDTPIITSSALSSTGGLTWYFKAGCYAQSNDTIDDPAEYVSIELRDLECSHSAPSGPVNLITNGDFSSGSTGWNTWGWGAEGAIGVVGGAMQMAPADAESGVGFDQTVTVTAGVTYNLTFTVSGAAPVWVSVQSVGASYSAGTHTVPFTAASSSVDPSWTTTATLGTVTIDSISLTAA